MSTSASMQNSATAADSVEHKAEGTEAGEPVRVLVVEDDYDSYRIVERRLATSERALFEVEWAASLPDGLSEIGQHAFDVIVLDLALPGSEGLATIAGVSAIAKQIPIVVLTGSTNTALSDACARHGIQDYLVKQEQDGDTLTDAVLAAVARGGAGPETSGALPTAD